MFNNILFVGGIHGVGKSTICREVSKELNLNYLSASEVLKWREVEDNSKNKSVQNISDTQNRLIVGLNNIVEENVFYLLDGHYCLLNKQNQIEDVPLETFKLINPICLNLILGDIDKVKQRLESRDNKLYDYRLLENFQNRELQYATYLSKTLGITLNCITTDKQIDLLNSLRKNVLNK